MISGVCSHKCCLTLANVNLQLLGDLGHSLEVSRVEVMLRGRLRGDLFQLILHGVAHSHSVHLEACSIKTQ